MVAQESKAPVCIGLRNLRVNASTTVVARTAGVDSSTCLRGIVLRPEEFR